MKFNESEYLIVKTYKLKYSCGTYLRSRILTYKTISGMKRALSKFVNNSSFYSFHFYKLSDKVTDKLDLLNFLNKYENKK